MAAAQAEAAMAADKVLAEAQVAAAGTKAEAAPAVVLVAAIKAAETLAAMMIWMMISRSRMALAV